MREYIVHSAAYPKIKVVLDLSQNDSGVRTLGGEDQVQPKGPSQPRYGGQFVFQSGRLSKTAASYESMFKGLVRKYNKNHKEDEALPNITPHTMRHTFCTRLANAGMNPKALQYIMGHSNITMTLNYYAHATFAFAKAEMDRLAA